MDNLGRHKNKALRRPKRAAGATLLCLQHDAPDRTPIEPLIFMLNHRLRHATEPTRDAVCGAFAQSLDIISAAACANDHADAGHDRT
jgi:hypothetical protein